VYSAMTALNCNATPSMDQVSSYDQGNSATKVTVPEPKNLALDAGQGQYFLTYSHDLHSSARAITPDECGRVNVTFHVLLLSGRSHDTISASGEWIWMRCRESNPGHLARDLPVTLLSNLAYNHRTPTVVSLGIKQPRAFDHLKLLTKYVFMYERGSSSIISSTLSSFCSAKIDNIYETLYFPRDIYYNPFTYIWLERIYLDLANKTQFQNFDGICRNAALSNIEEERQYENDPQRNTM
jgi:hypothetical protein